MRRLLLSEAMPLRTTAALGDFSEVVPLPERFGDLTAAPFKCIRLTDRRFFAADHAMEVTEVFIDKQVTRSWASVLGSDATGRVWQELHFASPVPSTGIVTAAGRGRRSPVTGALIDSPADILARASELAGRDDDWSGLRAECSRFNLVAGGSFTLAQSVRAQMDEVASSFAAIWTVGMARLYPSSNATRPILDLAPAEVSALQVFATVVDSADVLRLWYDWSDAADKPLHFIELTASPARYGGVAKEVTYKWLRTPQSAEIVGRAVLARLAGERYDVTFDSSAPIRAGQWVRPVAHPEWPLDGADPIIMVLVPEIDPTAGTVHVSTSETLLSTPAIAVSAHSVALPDTIEAGLSVAFANGVATFTLQDADGRPIAGAKISLDGDVAKTTDSQGQVSFQTTAGIHRLSVDAVGFQSFELFVTI